MNTEKYILTIDNQTFIADELGYEYTQFDGEGSGRGDDATMVRDVKGLNNKLYAVFNDKDRWYGQNLSNLLKLIEKKECTVTYFDGKENDFVTKHMYITVSKCTAGLIDGNLIMKDPIEVHFIQLDVDNI